MTIFLPLRFVERIDIPAFLDPKRSRKEGRSRRQVSAGSSEKVSEA